jgi:hypothetical protein
MLHGTDDFAAVRQVVQVLKRFNPQEQGKILRWASKRLGLTGLTAIPATSPALYFRDFHRLLVSQKQSNDKLFAAAVAYAQERYAPPHFAKKVIVSADLARAAAIIGRQTPKHPSQTLINAAQDGFLKRVAYGKYSLTSKGRQAVESSLSPV